MKKAYLLSVEAPCTEKWEGFTPTPSGGFCSSCNKQVIDFTSMSEKEIIWFLSKSHSGTCGRFRQDQLNHTYYEPISGGKKLFWPLMRAGVASLLLLISQDGFAKKMELKPKTQVEYLDRPTYAKHNESGMSYEQTISGVVTDEDQQPLPGVNVWLKGSNSGIITDVDGRFTFPVALNEGDILVFSFIGLETKEYTLGKETSIEVEMLIDQLELMGALAITEISAEKPSRIQGFWMKVKALF